jgi:uncharacterized protein YfiM (DUF2279 family)
MSSVAVAAEVGVEGVVHMGTEQLAAEAWEGTAAVLQRSTSAASSAASAKVVRHTSLYVDRDRKAMPQMRESSTGECDRSEGIAGATTFVRLP